MSELTINFSDYKSSGVYFVERDNSIIQASSRFTARLAAGFCEGAPFNRPIYISNTGDCDKLLGPINRKLERKGCFTNRAVRNMVTKAPVYLINLLPVDTEIDSVAHVNRDKVGLNAVSFDINKDNAAYTGLFADMFDRSKFWIADENAMLHAVHAAAGADDELHAPLYGVGNCGSKDVSLIIRKAEGLTGYNVTFREWYGSDDQIPYKWINPDDYVSDYFIQVIAVAGNWNKDQYVALAQDPVWRAYFNDRGLKKEMVNKFLHLDAVTVLGNWTGCIIPNFFDKQNKNKSIDYAINRTANVTGLLFGVNNIALDALAFGTSASTGISGFYLDTDGDSTFDEGEEAPYAIDLVGHTFVTPTDASGNTTDINFMSYVIPASKVANVGFDVEGVVYTNKKNEFVVSAEDLASVGDGDGEEILVGDYVKTTTGYLGKVTKKLGGNVKLPVIDASTGHAVVDASGNIVYEFKPGFIYTVAGEVAVTGTAAAVYQVENSELIPDDDNTETTAAYQDFMVLGNGEVDKTSEYERGTVTILKSVISAYDTLNFIPLKGLKLANRHMPGYDKDGNIDVEAGVKKIYEMLEDDAIRRGLLNNEQLDFRYIVDTLAGGMGEECGGKVHLARLARDKQHCTALISIPAVSDFAKSDAPVYCDTYVQGRESKKSFNAKYIATGGNQDMFYSQEYTGFSIITEDNGAKNCALFTPYLKYADGSNTILVPPAADVSNTFMNKFLGGDPYKTVANTTGYINNANVTGLEYLYDQIDRDSLEPNGINPIIVRNGSTYTIYGDRTAYQRYDSDYNFLHVRELLNTIELKCYAVLQDYPFTYNIPQTRAEIITRLTPILQTMKDAGALVKFEIQVDENNNDKEVIDNKFCIIDIGVWISQNMEKLVARLTLNRSTNA